MNSIHLALTPRRARPPSPDIGCARAPGPRRRPLGRPISPALFLCGFVFLACADDGTAPGGARLVFLSGDGLTDTALATPATPLVAQIFDEEGRFATGAIARFEGLPSEPDATPTMTVLPSPRGNLTRSFVFDTADERGRVSVHFQMGRVAGPGSIGVFVSGLGLADTARFTILPGAPVGVRAEPSDTALYVAATYGLRAVRVDQHGNARSDDVTFITTALDPAIAVEGSNRVTGVEFGRARALVNADPFTDTAFVSVVPNGTLAVYRPAQSEGDTAGTLLIELDLSNPRYMEFRVGEPAGARSMDWSPDGQRIVFDESNAVGYTLFRVEPDGRVERLIETDYGIIAEVWPQYSPDGAWIYYGGRRMSLTGEIWRVRADGSEPERVGPPAADFEEDAQPSVSPDGRRVVYMTDRDFSWELRVLDLETGGVESLGLAGEMPRWSPVDDRIAYFASDGVRVVNGDGTGGRVVTSGGGAFGPPMDWSPDGAWLVAHRQFSGIEVINVETGLVLPLPGTRDLHSPAWRP